VLVMGSGLVLLFLFLAFNGMSRHPNSPKARRANSTLGSQSAAGSLSSDSLAPIIDLPRALQDDGLNNSVAPVDIGRTVRPTSKAPAPRNLASVRPFDNSSWQPPPFAEPETPAGPPSKAASPQPKTELKSLDRESLVFTAKALPLDSIHKLPAGGERRIQLPPGTRLRARLQSAVNSATAAPVQAVVEYNYEQNGELAVPAGALLTGHLETVDRSGYLEIRFGSMTVPEAPPIRIEAVATDLQLGPLRGRVEGKHAGRNVLIRSAAGIGEVAATLVGRGSLNQPLSEEDLLRERLSNNIGQAADQQLSSVAVSQHVVATLPAGTEIYVVLEQRSEPVPVVQSSPNVNVKNAIELEQLLEVQRELTANVRSEDH
jgi:hypothetical protein